MGNDQKRMGFVDSSLNVFVEGYISKNIHDAAQLQQKFMKADRDYALDHTGILLSVLDIESLSH